MVEYISNNMPTNKKGLLIPIIVIVVIALAVAAYFFIIKKAAKPIVWDGSYKMTGTLTCTGNFPGLTTVPMDTTVIVSNNKIVDESIAKSFDIDKHGKATEIIEQATNNGVTSDAKAGFQFYKEDNAYKFTADGTVNISATQNDQKYSSTCSGTVTGVKQ
jgi:hypothetical protein